MSGSNCLIHGAVRGEVECGYCTAIDTIRAAGALIEEFSSKYPDDVWRVLRLHGEALAALISEVSI